MFGWTGPLSPGQTDRSPTAKEVIFDAFRGRARLQHQESLQMAQIGAAQRAEHES